MDSYFYITHTKVVMKVALWLESSCALMFKVTKAWEK